MVLEYTKGKGLETQLKDTHKTQNLARAASAISAPRTERLISPLLPACRYDQAYYNRKA